MISGRSEHALDGYRLAVGFLPELAWHGTNRSTREHHLGTFRTCREMLPGARSSLAEHRKAVELMETGRAVLWTQLLRSDAESTALAQRSPHFADRLRELSLALGSAG